MTLTALLSPTPIALLPWPVNSVMIKMPMAVKKESMSTNSTVAWPRASTRRSVGAGARRRTGEPENDWKEVVCTRRCADAIRSPFHFHRNRMADAEGAEGGHGVVEAELHVREHGGFKIKARAHRQSPQPGSAQRGNLAVDGAVQRIMRLIPRAKDGIELRDFI